MAVVRCLGCGEAFEAMGTTAACPECGTVMRITGGQAVPPPGVKTARVRSQTEAQAEMMTPEPTYGGSIPMASVREKEPWLGPTAKLWLWIIVGVVGFGLFVDWFRMKITPAKTVVDQTQVEKLAHELSAERINELALKVQKAEEAARKAQPPAPQTAPVVAQGQPPVATPGGAATTGTSPVNPPAMASQPGATNVAAATVATSRPVRNAAFASLGAIKPVRPTDLPAGEVTDAQIEESLRRGVNWLAEQFATTRLKGVERYGSDVFGGANAIAVYALLTAGQAIRDERIGPGTPMVKNLLDGLREMRLEGGMDTYARSLRISALTVFNRRDDRATIEGDVKWLLDSSLQGAFNYSKPPPGVDRSGFRWDNSNSQYGGLGLWAASEAGFRVPNQFWKDVENHWSESQVKMSGGWAYERGNGPATVTMTSAGANMLMVARDQMMVEGATQASLAAPLSKPVERALEWLDEGDHTVNFSWGGHYGYTLYGIERVGLASGYKYFGKYDWYQTLARRSVENQQKDGRWEGGDGAVVETAFHLLFLARGREPVFMGKLRWPGNWSNRPRDVASLTRFAGRALERSMQWQVLGLQRGWTDWTDAPVLLITGAEAPAIGAAEVEKLRNYALAGGLVLTHAENGSAAFNEFAADLAKRMFPDYPMTPLPAGHGMYSAVFPVANAPALAGVSNGSRLLMVHAGSDLTKGWGVRPPSSNERDRTKTAAAELGVNIVSWATGKRDLRRRTDPAYIADRPGKPVGTIPVARLRYDGNWDPEPWGWTRTSRKFDRETSVRLDVRPVDVVALEPGTAPVAHLTGTAARTFADAEVKVVREYVEAGGVLLVDACGGSPAFAESVRANLVARAFPSATASAVSATHPVMGRGRALMADIERILTRGDGASQAAGLRVVNAGKGALLFTDLDLSTGLLGTTVSGVKGYEPTVAERLVQNVIVWSVWPEGAPEMEGETKE